MNKCSNTSCWKDYPFSIELSLHLCQRINWSHLCASIFGLYFVPLTYIFISLLIPLCLYYFGFIINIKIGCHEWSNFILLFQNCFDYSSSVGFPHKFKKYVCPYLQKLLLGFSLELCWIYRSVSFSRENLNFNYIEYSNSWTYVSPSIYIFLHLFYQHFIVFSIRVLNMLCYIYS